MSINIKLDNLDSGLPTLSSKNGSQLAEMALFCLSRHGHTSEVTAEIVEGNGQDCIVSWDGSLDPRTAGSYGDIDEATEYGATAIAILYALQLTGQNSVQRAAKGKGFDYWVGDKDSVDEAPFQNTTRLEISGIDKGTLSQVKERYRIKQRQISKSDNTLTPKIVFIMEFSKPQTAVEYIS